MNERSGNCWTTVTIVTGILFSWSASQRSPSADARIFPNPGTGASQHTKPHPSPESPLSPLYRASLLAAVCLLLCTSQRSRPLLAATRFIYVAFSRGFKPRLLSTRPHAPAAPYEPPCPPTHASDRLHPASRWAQQPTPGICRCVPLAYFTPGGVHGTPSLNRNVHAGPSCLSPGAPN